MELTLHTAGAGKSGTITVNDTVFGQKFNEALVHQVLVAYMAAGRAGTKAQKTRAEVRGGGKKPWKQKGTGRARQGSTRASHWVGGGKAMGPKPRDYTYRPPKSVRKGALRAALSLRAKEKALVILNDFQLGEAKSKKAFEALTKRLKLKNALVVELKANTQAHRAIRNLASFDVAAPEGVNVESILRHKQLVLTQSAAKQLEGSLS